MTAEDAKAKGYVIDWASPLGEVGLIKNGKGICTWFYSSFPDCGGKLPPLDHPKIQEAIEIIERHPEDWP